MTRTVYVGTGAPGGMLEEELSKLGYQLGGEPACGGDVVAIVISSLVEMRCLFRDVDDMGGCVWPPTVTDEDFCNGEPGFNLDKPEDAWG